MKLGVDYPKIELHCHLDGSVRPSTIQALLASEMSIEAVEEVLRAPVPCDSLDTYLTCFERPIEVMQTYEALERIAFEVMEDAAIENVKYIELRFAPQLHTAKGLTYDQIISTVLSGMKRAENAYEIKGNLILSYLRNTSPEGILEVIKAGEPFLENGVVALDLCGGEHDLFSERFKYAFDIAREKGYKITIHAGETGILENVLEAVSILGATRIGHGTALMQSERAMAEMATQHIAIECCPTSNLQTKAVKTIREHPIMPLLERGVCVSINTDNRTVSSTTMTDEWLCVADAFEFSEALIQKITAQSIAASFASDAIKSWLKSLCV